MPGTKRPSWLVDLVVGGVVGGIVGAIVAWNVAIFLGVPHGYESGIREVFEHSPVAGVLWIAALISGPLAGVLVARRQCHWRAVGDKASVGTH